MKNLFEQSRSHWVRYDRYELKTAADGKRYITPGKNAKPDIYNPLKEAPGIVLDALNVGMLMMNRSPEDEVQKAILEFVTHYGLLGLMTALPTTPSFMDYEKVYLPKNHFIKAESMETEDYLARTTGTIVGEDPCILIPTHTSTRRALQRILKRFWPAWRRIRCAA